MYTWPHWQGILYVPGVFSPRLSFTEWRKLKIFLGSRSALLQLSLAAILLRQPYVVWTYGRRVPEVGLYLLKNVPVFLESGHEEFQLIMEDFLVAQSPGPLHQCCKNGFFAGRMVLWSGTGRGLCGYVSDRPYGLVSHTVSCRCICPKEDGGCSCLSLWYRNLSSFSHSETTTLGTGSLVLKPSPQSPP